MSSAPPVRPTKSSVFLKRLTSTLALWAIIAAAVWTGNQWLFIGVIAGIAGLALIEWCRMVGDGLTARLRVWLYLVGVGYAVMVIWHGRRTGHGEPGLPEALALPGLLFGLFAVTLTRPVDGRATLWAVFAAVVGFIYLPFLFSFVWRLLLLPHWDGGGPLPGVFYLVFVIAVTKFTDMGAYFFGMLLGRHKMIPHISPAKTWEGLGGAFVGAFVAAHGMVAIFGGRIPLIDHGRAAVLAIGLGAVAVVADLAESVVKRCLDVKDSGHVLPGIGGVLDLIDSLLFTAPAAWLYLTWIARS